MSINSLLHDIGLNSEGVIAFLEVLITLVIGGLLGWLAYIVAKKWLAALVMKIAGTTAAEWDNLLFDQRFFNRLGILFAPIVIKIGLSSLEPDDIRVVIQILNVWIVFASILLISSVLDGVNRIYESFPVSKDKPLKVFIQVIMIFLYCAGIIITISMFTGKDATVLLGGLTAFAAVLMLIFKDSILGLVAGIQLSANNMVRIGDWIVMPACGADGDVLEINLTTVKVQNWDKTITTIPTYKLVSESFTNWRGMQESKGRRIKRSVNIDMNSIHYLTDDEIAVLRQSALLNEYIEGKLKEIDNFNLNQSNLLDKRRLTNIGTFREYMEAWLSGNPNVNLEMTHMVRQLQSTPTGVPLEIYCFSARQKWIEYEDVQSDIFDHVFAVMELFNLKAFQYSGSIPFSGSSIR